MPRSDYEDKMVEDLKEIKKKWSYSTPEDAFVHFCLRIVSNLDDDKLCAESYTNGANDLEIDGIMIVEGDPSVIHFIQAKHIKSDSKVDRGQIKEFVDDVIKVLRNPEFSLTGNSNIVRLSRDARSVLKDAPDTKVILSYFNFGKYTPNAIQEVNDWKNKFKKEIDFVKNFELQIFDHDAIINTYRLNLDTAEKSPDVVLPISYKQISLYEKDISTNGRKTKRKSVVFSTLVSEIANLRNTHGRSLFSLNVRYSLGTTNEVNKGMMNTLMNGEEKDKFWFYNNGIYATCDSFEISEDKKTIKINGMQVVNGCQTCTTFGEALYKGVDLSNAEVMMRLVEGRKEKLIGNISRFTNTQNAVKARDLRSNDPIQDKLFQSFQDIEFWGKKYFYERKRGEMKHFSQTRKAMTRGREKIDNKDVAQASLAFVKLKASTAKAGADKLFQNNYTEIFIDGITEASHIFYPWYVSKKLVEPFVKQQQTISGQEYLSHSHSTFIAFVGYCFGKKFGTNDIGKLSEEFFKMREDNFVRHVNHYLTFGLKAINLSAMAKNGGKMPDENFDARRHFLDQDLLVKSVIPTLKNIAVDEKDIWTPPKS